MWRVPATEPERRTPETTETTGTQESFKTVPELSEPVERLFETLFAPKKQTSLEINAMAGSSTDVTMKDGTTKPTELKLNQPKPFTGKREELKKFIQDVKLYTFVNGETYNNDIKKISFALSFMNEGDAAAWKEQLLEEEMAKTTPFDLGTWDTFESNLKEAFKPYDAPGDALEEMKNIRMGNNSIEEHNARFKMIITKSDLDETSPAVIDYYRQSLNIPLQRRILSLETPPATFKAWCDWASKLDNNWRKMQRILGRSKENGGTFGKKEEPKRRFNFTRKDPNAMDIDTLTVEKRNEMMKKGQCFGCGETGHLNRDCPKKKKPSTSPPSYTPPAKKMGPKELYTHIRSLTTEMTDDERNEFFNEAEKEGF